jgi:hypothetical protein
MERPDTCSAMIYIVAVEDWKEKSRGRSPKTALKAGGLCELTGLSSNFPNSAYLLQEINTSHLI